MTDAAAPDPSYAQALADLTALGLGMARAVAAVAEAERRTVAAACRWLHADDAVPASREEAAQIGLGIDAADEAIAKATPRLAILTQCFDRIARATRRTIALASRLEQGWPLPRSMSDDRRAMLLRQAVRATRETIRLHNDGEAAERLFADLDARLDDPAFEQDLLERPVKEMVRLLCRAIGIAPEGEPALAPTGSPASPPARRHDPG